MYIVRSHLCFYNYLSGCVGKCKMTPTLNSDYLWRGRVLKRVKKCEFYFFYTSYFFKITSLHDMRMYSFKCQAIGTNFYFYDFGFHKYGTPLFYLWILKTLCGLCFLQNFQCWGKKLGREF